MISYVHNEPETPAQMMQFLYDKLQETEWPYVTRTCARGCNGYLGSHCQSCEAEKGEEHEPGCEAKATLVRIEAYLRVEAQLEAEAAEKEWAASCSAG